MEKAEKDAEQALEAAKKAEELVRKAEALDAEVAQLSQEPEEQLSEDEEVDSYAEASRGEQKAHLRQAKREALAAKSAAGKADAVEREALDLHHLLNKADRLYYKADWFDHHQGTKPQPITSQFRCRSPEILIYKTKKNIIYIYIYFTQ